MTFTLAEFFDNCLDIDKYNEKDAVYKYKFFNIVKKEFDPCHVPSSHFSPYPISLVPTYRLISETIVFIVEKYKLKDDKWSDYKDSRSLFLSNEFEKIITEACSNLTNFNNVDLSDIETNLISVIKEYTDSRKEQPVDNPTNPVQRIAPLKRFFKYFSSIYH